MWWILIAETCLIESIDSGFEVISSSRTSVQKKAISIALVGAGLGSPLTNLGTIELQNPPKG